MKNYIIGKIHGPTVCTHPQVEGFWEWGGGSMTDLSDKIYHYATVLLKDGTRHDFGPNDDYKITYYECNHFLNKIPEE